MKTQVSVEDVSACGAARGAVFEPVADADLRAARHLHVVLTEPGAVRGNHYHRCGTEIAVIRGPALVRYRAGAVVSDVQAPEGRILRFRFPPDTPHAFKNTGAAPMVLVSSNTDRRDPEHLDTYREPLLD
jgi:UDP-2-acetamido-2,6-beta-L-arabino-hexul-4-ose reductase